jgi:hypothetical protein
MKHVIMSGSLSCHFVSVFYTDLPYLALHITKFLTVLTLLHEEKQFNKYDKNITRLLLAYFHGSDTEHTKMLGNLHHS